MPAEGPTNDERARLTRRRMLRGAAATGVGAAAGAVIAGAAPAANAAAGDPMVLGPTNNAGIASTQLVSTASTDAFEVTQNGAQGTAIHASTPSSAGIVVLVEGLNTSSTNPVLQATSTGAGYAVYGFANGTGRGVVGYVGTTTSTASAIYGATIGTGAAVEGKAVNGRGGRFAGRFAAINLVPGGSPTHPSHGGVAGDLFVDSTGRLWFCRGSNNWVQVV